jgi:hypothetical protein
MLCTHSVRYLLMGGQACIFYGAAEFSRDCDIALLCEPDNLARLQAALNDLETHCIAVPPFEPTGIRTRGRSRVLGTPCERNWSNCGTSGDNP